MLVKATIRDLKIAIREGRAPDKVTAHNGVYLEPGGAFAGPLPLNVRRGTATFGIHSLDDRITKMRMAGGDDLAVQLLTAADEFEAVTADHGPYTARDFVTWLLPEIVGTTEHTKHQEARLSVMGGGRPKGD